MPGIKPLEAEAREEDAMRFLLKAAPLRDLALTMPDGEIRASTTCANIFKPVAAEDAAWPSYGEDRG